MEIDSLKKRLIGIDRTVLAITEMCERRAPACIHSSLFSIQRDARRLSSLLRLESADDRCAECLEHLKEAGRQLQDSCADVDHKDTRAALEDLTTVLIALPHPGMLHH
ncbi:hypothetical protein [Noviherbaspirillum aridicola]|uniref:Uncharacterized protein n=1 Tax=Noviherbaspirillum aridicola TaxID=2849687 RepID=A0ABQ4Q8E0_9BURK|nr:hypothetical protein [Noviherbaspirillum aridicola]GIZ53342.1 hypothetical protein NCCP691_33560 [Noviherbaspirillum aridicola]